jgi:heat shock protein HtpX
MKTFWDIDKEKTWRIYVLFGVLVALYFVPIYTAWILLKIILDIRKTIGSGVSSVALFGWDTLVVLLASGGVSAVHWYYSNKNVVSKVLNVLGAISPDKNDAFHEIFENVIDELSVAAGSISVERYVVPTGAMNAFALADMSGRSVVGVTEGLLSRLSRDELQGVMAHEIAHIVSQDSLQTTTICSLFGIYSEALSHLNRVSTAAKPMLIQYLDEEPPRPVAAGAVASFPLMILLFVTDLLGQFLNMFISREKEYRADANAVKYSRNPIALARALYKIATHWRGAGYGGEYLAPIFILRPEHKQMDEQDGAVATMFSTHPPVTKRLQILLDMGHASLDELSQQLRVTEGLKTEMEPDIPAVHYYVQHKDEWRGPYSLMQMHSLEWLQPGSMVRIGGKKDAVTAHDVPALHDIFSKREQPLYKVRRLCPDCREWLVVQEYEGLHIWHCGFCHGMFVGAKKLPRIFVRKKKGFSERVQRMARILFEQARKKTPKFNIMLGTAHPRQCPKCGKSMSHKFYSYAYHIEIDECTKCGAFWFDVDELELLQCLIEMGEMTADTKR